jgi:hypothetical protein
MNWGALFTLSLCQLAAYATECVNDDDCRPLNTCVDELCTHKALLEVHGYEWAGTILLILATGAVKSIAIGSKSYADGPATTFILYLGFYFSPLEIYPYSCMVDFGGSISIVAIALFQRHPTKDRPLIDFDLLALVSLPMFYGTVWGLMIRSMFPPWLILVYALWIFIKVAYHAIVK